MSLDHYAPELTGTSKRCIVCGEPITYAHGAIRWCAKCGSIVLTVEDKVTAFPSAASIAFQILGGIPDQENATSIAGCVVACDHTHARSTVACVDGVNRTFSWTAFYGTRDHRTPIVGDAVDILLQKEQTILAVLLHAPVERSA